MIFKNKKISDYVPVAFLVVIALIFFYKFFLYKFISMPADITVGMYYPWIDQKWSGLTTNVPVKNPLMSDIVSIIYQWRFLVINSFKQGEFPFWTHSYLSGVPLFANFQNSLFNITNLPFLILNNNGFSWTIMVLSQLIISLLATFFCLRTLKFEKLSSIVGSIVYSFSLFNLIWLEYGIHTYVAAFLPLFVVCIEKYFQKKQRRFLIYLSFLIALQFFGGYPQYSIFSLIFIFIYFLFIFRKNNIKSFGYFSLSIVLGLLLTLPLLLPGYELIKRSIRDIDITSQSQTMGFIPVQNLLTLPIPNYWGNPATSDYYGLDYYDNNAIFPGSIALISLFLTIYLYIKHKTSKKINFFILTIFLCILIIFKNPFSLFLKNNFGFIFSGNGISTRIFLLANFSFSVLSAFVFDNIIHQKSKKIFPLLGLLIWQLLIFLNLYFQNNPNKISYKNTLYSFIFSLFIVISIVLSQLQIKFKKVFIYITIFLVICESFYYGFKYLPFSKQEYLFPSTPSIKFLQENIGNYRISTTNTIPTNMWVTYGLDSPDGYDTMMPLLNYEYYSLVQNQDYSKTANRAIYYNNEKSSLYDNLSIKYKLTLGNGNSRNITDLNKKFIKVFGETNTIIEKNQHVLDKIRFVEKIITAKDKIEFKKIYQDIDFSKNVVLYDYVSNDIENINNGCVSKDTKISNVEYKNNSIKFSTNNNCTKPVFISNSFYPGWEATIDGNTTEIFQANHAFQSVIVPPGYHQVVLKYTPTNFRTYLYISIGCAISLIIFLLYDYKKK